MQLETKWNKAGGKEIGPGIELFLFLIAFVILSGVGIVWVIAILMTKAFKVKTGSRGIILVVLFFSLCFSISSLVLQGKEDGVTVGFFGDPRRYEGSHLFYGFPEIWFRKFEPYDSSVRNRFFFPNNYYFVGIFVDFTFWLAIAVILAYVAKFLWIRRREESK